MRITLTSIFVDDQAKAEAFYTDVLGFVKKADVPVGQFRWLTVVSPDEPDGTELLLEPNDNPAARTYQAAIFAQGILLATFAVADIHAEYERLTGRGVQFAQGPIAQGPIITAVFEDTCGNFIQLLYQP